MKTTITTVVLLLLMASKCQAQQAPAFTQYYYNPLIVNSAYAGTNDGLNINFVSRDQWIGVAGRPKSRAFTIDSPFRSRKMAVGVSVMTDDIGPSHSTTIAADFAYRIYLTRGTRMAFGLKASHSSYVARLSGLKHTDPSDQNFSNDIRFNGMANFGFSTYVWNERFYGGLSVPRIVQNDVDGTTDYLQGREKRHYYAYGGYVHHVNSQFIFKPTLMIRYVWGAPVGVELSPNLLINEKIWVGMNYRLRESLGLTTTFHISEEFRVGYSYDFIMNGLAPYTGGSHEFMIGYLIKYKKASSFVKCYF